MPQVAPERRKHRAAGWIRRLLVVLSPCLHLHHLDDGGGRLPDAPPGRTRAAAARRFFGVGLVQIVDEGRPKLRWREPIDRPPRQSPLRLSHRSAPVAA